MKTNTQEKQCPLKFASTNRIDWGVDCSGSACAWWDTSYGKCTVIIEGFLAGWKQAQEER